MRIILFLGFFFISCRFSASEDAFLQTAGKISQPLIVIQPFNNIDSNCINYLKNNICNYYKLPIKTVANTALPIRAFYAKRNRYVADSLLQFLKPISQNTEIYIVGVTDKDISTSSNGVANWGIMGLGYRSGNAAVISTYRLGKKASSRQQVYQRLLKVALHELGHNFGLPHCANQTCIMVDAEGKNKLDGEKEFCENCHLFLHKNNLIKKGVTGL